jgi:hypothetical protein
LFFIFFFFVFAIFMYWWDFLAHTVYQEEGGQLVQLLRDNGIYTNRELIKRLALPPVLPEPDSLNKLVIPTCLCPLVYQYLAKARVAAIDAKKQNPKKGRFTVETEVLQHHRLFEYGYQPRKQIYYVRYCNMLTLDYDGLDITEVVSDTQRLAARFCVSFHLYTTNRGVHAFLVSRTVLFFSELVEQIYAASLGDRLYLEYCVRNGYTIRVSLKPAEPAGAPVRRFLRVVGSEPDHPLLTFLVGVVQDYTCQHTQPDAPGEVPGLVTVVEDQSAYSRFVREVVNAPTEPFYPGQILQYRRYLEARLGPTWETVRLLAPYFRKVARKPQLPICEGSDDFVALDITSKTAYMNFSDILMVDVDLPDQSPAAYLGALQQKCEAHGVSAAVYGTPRGYHLFFVDRARAYHHRESVELALAFGCDLYYCVYSYIRGWCVRLSPKAGEPPEGPLYSYLGVVGLGPRRDLLDRVVKHYTLSLDRTRLLQLIHSRYTE